ELTSEARSTPGDPRPQLELALMHRQTNNLPEAERRLKAIWKQYPTFPRAPYHLGMLYLAQGRAAAAAAPLQAAADLDKGDPQTQVNAGHALLGIGDERAARRYAESAVRLDPKAPDAYLLLAQVNDHHGTALQA